MKIIFVLDDQTILVANPEELQLRQIETGVSALVLPAGKNEKNEDLFRPLVTYPVVLAAPPKPEPINAGVATAVPTAPVRRSEKTRTKSSKPVLKSSKGKKPTLIKR